MADRTTGTDDAYDGTAEDAPTEPHVHTAVLFEQQRVNFGWRPTLDVATVAARVLDTLHVFLDNELEGRAWLGVVGDDGLTWSGQHAGDRLEELANDVAERLALRPDSEQAWTFVSGLLDLRVVMDFARYDAACRSVAADDDDELLGDLDEVAARSGHQPPYVSLTSSFIGPGFGAYWHLLFGIWSSWPPTDFIDVLDAPLDASANVPTTVEQAAELVEHVYYDHLASTLGTTLINLGFDLDLTKRIEGRYPASASFYCYGLTASPNAPGAPVQFLRTHLATSSTGTIDTSSSLYDGTVRVVRREHERADGFKPLYLLLIDGHRGDGQLRSAHRAVENYSLVELAIAHELWDISTDLEMVEHRLKQLGEVLDRGGDRMRELAASTEQASGRAVTSAQSAAAAERIVYQALRDQQIAAQNATNEAERITEAIDTFRFNVESHQRSSFDEQAASSALTVRQALLGHGWIERLSAHASRVLTKGRAKLELNKSLVQTLAGAFDARRAEEVHLLERGTYRMNVMLGFLAAVLALDTLVEYKMHDPSDLLLNGLRALVVLSVAAAIAVVVRTPLVSRRRRERAARKGQEVYRDIVGVQVDIGRGLEATRDAATIDRDDHELASRLTGLIDLTTIADGETEQLLAAERWALWAMLIGTRPAPLYDAPYPRLAMVYASSFALSPFEFEHTLDRAGFRFHTDKLRAWCSDVGSGMSAAEVLTALDEAGFGYGTDVDHSGVVATLAAQLPGNVVPITDDGEGANEADSSVRREPAEPGSPDPEARSAVLAR